MVRGISLQILTTQPQEREEKQTRRVLRETNNTHFLEMRSGWAYTFNLIRISAFRY